MPPEIDYEKCTGCGQCVEMCSEDVFFRPAIGIRGTEEKPVVTYPEVCWHCNWCVKECPAEAIWLRTPLPMMVPHK